LASEHVIIVSSERYSPPRVKRVGKEDAVWQTASRKRT
jgi:hypothetical protein